MHPLREAMLDQMRLRGHSPRTQQSYLQAVSLLSRHIFANSSANNIPGTLFRGC